MKTRLKEREKLKFEVREKEKRNKRQNEKGKKLYKLRQGKIKI